MEQFVLMIYQGSTPLPGTPEWDALPQGGTVGDLRRLRSDQPDARRQPGPATRTARRRAHRARRGRSSRHRRRSLPRPRGRGGWLHRVRGRRPRCRHCPRRSRPCGTSRGCRRGPASSRSTGELTMRTARDDDFVAGRAPNITGSTRWAAQIGSRERRYDPERAPAIPLRRVLDRRLRRTPFWPAERRLLALASARPAHFRTSLLPELLPRSLPGLLPTSS